MSVVLRFPISTHRYGKSGVRLLRVHRQSTHHEIDDWTVEVLLSGEFEEVFTAGDNTRILATDTMKNTVYFLARQSRAESLEEFARELSDFLLQRNPQVSRVEVRIESHLWKRLTVDGEPFPTAFMRGSDERQTTRLLAPRDGQAKLHGGLEGMTVLKTAQSGFVGFLRDELTTLPETTDRLFGTVVAAEWLYEAHLPAAFAFASVRDRIRETMLSTFARHHSLSVQQTLYAMACAALEGAPELLEIHLSMPNRHNLLIDLDRFGLDNPNQVFVPTTEPSGLIEATVRRS